MNRFQLLSTSAFPPTSERSAPESVPVELSIFRRAMTACGKLLSSISGHPAYYRQSYSEPFARRYSFMEEASWPDN
jgi:hypothetical protein